ncbi:MAG TPA: hypothetical protein VD866_13920 [Urbifossiella sp.]|nr:hypothetical protein [Urbifossiella sp.]
MSNPRTARQRKVPGLATLMAVRFNSVLKAFFDRLVAPGRPKMHAMRVTWFGRIR